MTDETCREQQNTLSHTTMVWRARGTVPRTPTRKRSQNRGVPWIIVGDSNCRFVVTTIESTFSLYLTRHWRWAVFLERKRERKRNPNGAASTRTRVREIRYSHFRPTFIFHLHLFVFPFSYKRRNVKVSYCHIRNTNGTPYVPTLESRDDNDITVQ